MGARRRRRLALRRVRVPLRAHVHEAAWCLEAASASPKSGGDPAAIERAKAVPPIRSTFDACLRATARAIASGSGSSRRSVAFVLARPTSRRACGGRRWRSSAKHCESGRPGTSRRARGHGVRAVPPDAAPALCRIVGHRARASRLRRRARAASVLVADLPGLTIGAAIRSEEAHLTEKFGARIRGVSRRRATSGASASRAIATAISRGRGGIAMLAWAGVLVALALLRLGRHYNHRLWVPSAARRLRGIAAGPFGEEGRLAQW